MSNTPSKPRRRGGGRPTQQEQQGIETAILESASRAFMERGFDRASMDEIAEGAHTSKQTIYARYPTKANLFAAFISWRFQNFAAPTLANPTELDMPPEQYLQLAGTLLLNNNVGPEGRKAAAFLRTALVHSPEMAQAFWVSGPGRGRDLLQQYLRIQITKGTLLIPDLELATEQFDEPGANERLHQEFGPTRFLLVRPDGYVACRSDQQHEAEVHHWLSTWLPTDAFEESQSVRSLI